MTSLFRRLERYGFNAARDPAEARLTESFAATLGSAPAVTRFVVEELLAASAPPGGEISVTTQRRTSAGDYVDVELRFGEVVQPSLVVWLELKWNAPLGPNQMERYRYALDIIARWTGAQTRLALIAARAVDVPEDLPEGCVGLTWQDISRSMKASVQGVDETESLLVTDFTNYLEEHQLATTGGFTAADVVALDQYSDTVARLRGLITMVDSALGSQLTHVGGDGPRVQNDAPWALEFFRLYQPDTKALLPEGQSGAAASPLPGWAEYNVKFEWHFRWDAARGSRERGIQAFAAGVVCLDDQNLFGAADYKQWLQNLAAADVEYVRGAAKPFLYYLLRFLYPAELVKAFDLPEQGDMLTKWVLDSFELLAQNPPPPPPSQGNGEGPA